MKFTARIILFILLLALCMQSATLAETKYQLKPAGEIAKNLFGMGVEKAKENPEQVEEVTKKLTGENETEKTQDATEDDKSED